MNDLNSYSTLRFEIESEECESWNAFADGIRKSQSWSSDWFATARRFFLSGGAKEFNPKMPEKDYNTRRISRRAAALIAPDNPAENEVIVRLMKRFYEIRSRITHGSRLGDENREWLFDKCDQVELRLRQVLVTAVQKLPPGEEDRRVALAELYDPTDEDRGSQSFCRNASRSGSSRHGFSLLTCFTSHIASALAFMAMSVSAYILVVSRYLFNKPRWLV